MNTFQMRDKLKGTFKETLNLNLIVKKKLCVFIEQIITKVSRLNLTL